MIKAIFFDVDGTLVSHKDTTVSPSTRAALKALKQTGIKCILATGRHSSELKNLPVCDMDFDGAVTLNGQLCLDRDGTVFFDNPITGEEKDLLLNHFREKTFPLLLVERDTLYINFVDDRVRRAQKAISTPIPPVGDYTGNPVYQVIAYVEPQDESLLKAQLPGCRITRWNPQGVDIISASGGKVAGIQAFLDRSGIARSETMAFGDGENDAEMLAFVQVGVAMGNAKESAKHAADYVTSSVDEDGIAKALEHFGLL